MSLRFAVIALFVSASGCIFGGGVPPDETVQPADAASPDASSDAGSDDDGGLLPEFLVLTPEPRGCADAPALLLVDASDLEAPEDPDAVVGVGEPPTRPDFDAKFAFSIAWVTNSGGSRQLRVATIQQGVDGAVVSWRGLAELPEMEGAEIFDVLIKGTGGAPEDTSPPLYDVTLMTSEGAVACSFTLTETAELRHSCSTIDALNEAAQTAQVFPPSSTRVLPRFRGWKFVDNPLWMAANSFWVARGGVSQDRLGALYFDLLNPTPSERINPMPLERVQTELLDYDPRATLVAGIDSRSGGFPYITMLGRDADDVLHPVVLAESDGAMVPLDDQRWPLPPGFAVDQPFAFASGAKVYVADTAITLGGIEYTLDPSRGEVRFGYATVSEEGDLILSRVGGFTADADFAKLELEQPALDVFSSQNLVPGDEGQTGARQFGRPLLMVVSGEARDRLSLFRWDVGLDVAFAGNVTRGTGVAQISDVKPVILLVNGKGLVSFRGRRDGALVIGTISMDLPGRITACR